MVNERRQCGVWGGTQTPMFLHPNPESNLHCATPSGLLAPHSEGVILNGDKSAVSTAHRAVVVIKQLL